jgi:AhpD family alkylhydroperoxidase
MATRLRYAELAPEGYAKLVGLGHYLNTGTALGPVLLGLVYLRASQLNECEFCIDLHSAELRHRNEPQSRIDAVAAWRGSDAFTPKERAALAWAESVTELQQSHVSDEDFAAVSEFFHEKDLADLTIAIANINAWNRLGVAFRMEWKAPARRAAEKTEAAKA